MTCIKCHGEMLGPRLVEMHGEFKGEVVTVQIEASECSACGHQTIAGKRMGEFMLKAADAYRAKHNLLTSAQIRTARLRLGMSQSKFAEWLGSGPASVKRWETGEVQTKAADELIRCKTDASYVEAIIRQIVEKEAIVAARRGQSAARQNKNTTTVQAADTQLALAA